MTKGGKGSPCLLSMKKGADLIGAKLKIDAKPGRGTNCQSRFGSAYLVVNGGILPLKLQFEDLFEKSFTF